MNACDICKLESFELYPIDGHTVCDACLMQGRLSEIPDYVVIELHELDPVSACATVSSWWNRDIPVQAVH